MRIALFAMILAVSACSVSNMTERHSGNGFKGYEVPTAGQG